MSRDSKGFTLLEIMVVVLIIATLLAVAIPNFMSARDKSRSRSCQQNLRAIATAKEQWAMDNGKTSTDGPLVAELVPAYIKSNNGDLPQCPSDGIYSIGNMSALPACSIGDNDTPTDERDDHTYSSDGG